jgi:membrane protease YdiL (CAAX protease family)
MSSPGSEPILPPPAAEAGEHGPGVGAPAGPPFPPWGIAGSLAVVAAFALTQLLVSLAFTGLLRWWGAAPGGDASLLLRIAVPVTLIKSHVVGWLAIYLLVVRWHRLRLVEALRLGRHPWRPALRAFLSGMGLQVLAVSLVLVFPPPPDFVSPIERFVRMGPWAVAMLLVAAVLLAPALEETMFRGLLLPALRRRFAFVPSAIVVTGLFTALHASQTGTYLAPLLGIAVCGWFLARWRERTGSLWPPLAFHAGFNLTAFLPILLLGQEF